GQVGQTGSPAPSTGVSADAPAAPSTDETIPFDAELDGLLLSPEPYYYQGLGRRDIFVSLVSEQYREDNPPSAPVSSQLHVVGILWAEKDRFALIETDDEKSMILREGDPVGDGTVIEILPNRVVIHVTEYGTSRNVSLPLEQRGDDHARSRNR
ncbi:MAG: hypothetical protein QUU85_16425, partial [Candidatus Eisenbacteria bacterium]|nr:hypothetical protein [Candidatus Eisenbacteria bacterium]